MVNDAGWNFDFANFIFLVALLMARQLLNHKAGTVLKLFFFQTNDHAEQYFVVTAWSLGGRRKSEGEAGALPTEIPAPRRWYSAAHHVLRDATAKFQEQLEAPRAAGASCFLFSNSQPYNPFKDFISFCALKEKL